MFSRSLSWREGDRPTVPKSIEYLRDLVIEEEVAIRNTRDIIRHGSRGRALLTLAAEVLENLYENNPRQ